MSLWSKIKSLFLPQEAPIAQRVLPQRMKRMSTEVTNERRRVILEVLREAERSLSAKEIMSRVRKRTQPPVQPPHGDRATRHLLAEPPLRGMLERDGFALGARWRLKVKAPVGFAATPSKAVARQKDAARASTVEVAAIARAILVTQGPMRLQALLPLVQERMAPRVVRYDALAKVLTASDTFHKEGDKRSPGTWAVKP